MLLFSILVLVINVNALQFGVNLASLEFGEHTLPGEYGREYTTPTTDELDYFKSKGVNVIRLCIRWERIQDTKSGPFRAVDIGRIDTFVNEVQNRKMKVLIDLHNYGRFYGDVIGSSALPHTDFVDIIVKLVNRYKDNDAIYGWLLMNEPHDIATDIYSDQGENWRTVCQLVIDAVRQIDTVRPIIVPGLVWSNAIGWNSKSGQHLISLTDPSDNIWYEAHSYFDSDNSGQYTDGTCSGINLSTRHEECLSEWVNWLRSNNKKGFLGEINTSTEQCWLTVLDNALAYLVQQKDVVMAITFWAGGPWWGDYPLLMDPTSGGDDRPQMTVLQNYISYADPLDETEAGVEETEDVETEAGVGETEDVNPGETESDIDDTTTVTGNSVSSTFSKILVSLFVCIFMLVC